MPSKRSTRSSKLHRRLSTRRVAPKGVQTITSRFPGFDIVKGPDVRVLMDRDTIFTTVHTVRFPAWITSSTLVEVFKTQSFSLDQLDDYKAYTTIFDEYMLNGVECMITPLVNVSPIVGQSVGMLASVIDTDDVTPLTTFAEAGHYFTCVTAQGSYTHLRVLRPKFSRAVFSCALVTGYGSGSGWLDSASPGVPHYALKAAWTTTSAPVQADLIVRYSFSFRFAV
jgi:hypothetical protein